MKTCNKHVNAIVNAGLCTGCGVCEGVCPKGVLDTHASKAICVNEKACINCGLCEKCCPSYGYELNNIYKNYYGVYEAASRNKEILKNASSGGVVTQILYEALESKLVDAVAVVTKCETIEDGFCQYLLTDNKDEILKTSGSNYVQASIGQLINQLKECNKKVVLVGLPCQLYGVSQAMKYNPSLKKNIVLKIGFFCGYTYDYNCIDGLSALLNCDVMEIKRIIGWREDGLPGYFSVEKKNGEIEKIPFIDEHSIDVTFYAHEKCMLCKDCFSDYADIVTGDIGRNWKDKKTLIFTRSSTGVYWFEKLSKNIEVKKLEAKSWKETPIAFMELEKRGKVSERIKSRKKQGDKVPIWSGDYNETQLLHTKKMYTRWAQKKQMRVRKRRELYVQNPQAMLRVGRKLYYQSESSFCVKYLYIIERILQILVRTNWWKYILDRQGEKEKIYRSKNDYISVAVIGLGSWGGQYIPLLQKNKGFHIVSIYDQNEAECDRIGKRFKIKKQLPAEMFQNDEIDTVFILTPNHLHYEMIMEAISYGKNVFVEKPLVNEYQDAKALYSKAKENQCYLYVGHSMKVSRGFATLKRIIDSGELGEIKQFSCVRSLHGMGGNIRMTWRSNAQLAPLLPMMQLGIHLIDASLYLFDELKCVSATAHEVCGLTDSVTCTLSSENITGTIMTCYDTDNTMEYVVYGSKAKAVLNETKLVYMKDGKRHLIENNLQKENTLCNELDDYYLWRMKSGKPINTLDRAIQTIEIFESIRDMV